MDFEHLEISLSSYIKSALEELISPDLIEEVISSVVGMAALYHAYMSGDDLDVDVEAGTVIFRGDLTDDQPPSGGPSGED
jgi:hypothetical protein